MRISTFRRGAPRYTAGPHVDPGSTALQPKSEPQILFFAPFVSSPMRIEPGWIDYNGHLNMAYYSVLFDRAIDEIWAAVGLGPDYRGERGMTTFAAQSNVSFLREVNLIDTVRITAQLIDHDEKRMHIWAEMRHADEGWLAATNESMHLHVDLASRRVAPMPPEVLANFAAMRAAHGALPHPAGLGKVISMRPQPREERARKLN